MPRRKRNAAGEVVLPPAVFPARLREARKKAGMTQTELGERIGVTQRSVTEYERGCAFPRRSTMARLAEALQVTETYLTEEEPETANRTAENVLQTVRAHFGERGTQEVTELLARSSAFFAGGSIPQEDKDAFFEALMVAYVTAKEEARAKYGHSARTDGKDGTGSHDA